MTFWADPVYYMWRIRGAPVGRYLVGFGTGLVNCKLVNRNFAELCLQCFDAVGWAAGRASGL